MHSQAFPNWECSNVSASRAHLVEEYGHEEEVKQEGLRSPAVVKLEENDGEDEREELVAGIAEGRAQKLHPRNCHQ